MPAIATIDRLLEYGAASRKLRAYAYLTASFETKPRYGAGVSDALDCIVPFVVAGTARQVGNQLSLPGLGTFLQTLGRNIPLYVLEQLLPRLQRIGAIEWDKTYHVHICKAPPEELATAQPPELAPVFDNIEQRLSAFADAFGISQPAASPSWADALIAFLKSESAGEVARAVNIKGAIIGEGDKIDGFVIARFIRTAADAEPVVFQQIVQIFTGILIEDFINTIQTLGDSASYKGLSVFYDTTVLLRLLGTSGKLLATATQEMHRALQDLGCQTLYFDHNESEVINIFTTLIAVHDAGKELFGETAEAILEGDVTIGTIRDLIGTYAKRLATMGVFKTKYAYSNATRADEHQIDEKLFEKVLEDAAIKQDKSYSRQNAEHDAMSLALIMRMRRGKKTKDVAQSIAIFVCRNQLLQKTARRFLVDHEGYDWTSTPAILTIGQISTVAWLAAAKTLEPTKVTKELLATCYSAMRPDAKWAETFLQALERFKGENKEQVEGYADSVLFLQTARSIAQEQSLGQTAILKKLNTVELFQRAAAVAEEKEALRRIEFEADAAERAEAQQAAFDAELVRVAEAAERRIGAVQTELEAQVADTERRLSRTADAAMVDSKSQVYARCERAAGVVITVVRIAMVCLFVLVAVMDIEGYRSSDGHVGLVVLGGLLALNVLASIHLTGIEILGRPLQRLRSWLTRRMYGFLTEEDAPPTVRRERGQ